MLTIPNEIVPLQIARGDLADSPLSDGSLRLAFAPPLGEGRVEVDLRAVLWAIDNILNSLRAVGGLAPRLVGRRLPRHLECDAQGVREPARAGDESAHLGNRPLAAAGRGGLAPVRPSWTPTRRLAARARLGIPRADLFHRALHRLPSRRTLGCLSHRPRHGPASGSAGRPASPWRTIASERRARRARVAGRHLGGPATLDCRLGALAGAADRSHDRRLHVTGPDRRPVGFAVDLRVAALAVRRNPPGGVYDGPPHSRVAPQR